MSKCGEGLRHHHHHDDDDDEKHQYRNHFNLLPLLDFNGLSQGVKSLELFFLFSSNPKDFSMLILYRAKKIWLDSLLCGTDSFSGMTG